MDQPQEVKPVEAPKQTGPRKIRILALCDSPTSATGFAQVSRNILTRLAKTGKFDIDVIGINYFGDYYDREKFPFQIYPAQPQGYSDMYGRGRIFQALSGSEEKFGLKPGYDILFTIQDSFILEGLNGGFPFAEQVRITKEMWMRTVGTENWFKWIGYFPVDSELKENWVTRSIALADFPVAYCEWGKKQMMKFEREKFVTTFNFKSEDKKIDKIAKITIPALNDRLSVIHHGVDHDVFHPISKEERAKFRESYFGEMVKPDTCLVINVSRNQPRKDLARTMKAFAQFHKIVENSHLYLHCRHDDAGGSIYEIARNFNLVLGKDFSVPKDFNAGVGYPIETVNNLYNAADMCITTTLGEGWGFITTEAMAAKTPIVAPNITSILDIFDSYEFTNDVDQIKLLDESEKVRGIPVKAATNSSEWVCLGIEDNERIRPLTNVDDMVEKMVWVHNNPEKVAKIVDRAHEWVKTQNWDAIAKQWESVITKAYDQLVAERTIGDKMDKTGRNDPCPCGSGQKFKKCHGSQEKIDRFKDWLEIEQM